MELDYKPRRGVQEITLKKKSPEKAIPIHEPVKELEKVLRGRFWQTSKIDDLNRVVNNAGKKKAVIRKQIVEVLADKLIDEQFSKSWKRLFKQENFQEYSIFFNALFNGRAKQDLKKVISLVVFSSGSSSTASRRAIEIAMKAYPRAIGWNDAEQHTELLEVLTEIAAFDYTDGGKRDDLTMLLQRYVDFDLKSSRQLITVKAYIALEDMIMHFDKDESNIETKLYQNLQHAYRKANKVA